MRNTVVRALMVCGALVAVPPAVKSEETSATSQRVEEILVEFRRMNDSVDKTEIWCPLMKELIEIGPDAVLPLCEELNATTENRMLRRLGFALRGINDPRAVPALIRAVPKLLQPAGSDYGLAVEDVEVAKFMRQHDLESGNNNDDGTRFSFGRPIREVIGALKKLTGQEFGAAELNFLHYSEDPRRQILQRRLFQRHAREWEAWWNEHGKERVSDPAYATVSFQFDEEELPPFTDEITTESKVSGGSGGAVLSPAVEKGKYSRHFLDLDTGYQPVWPAHIPQDEAKLDLKELEAWAEKEGVDLMCITHKAADGKETFILQTFGLSAWEVEAKYYQNLPELIRAGTIFELPAADGRLGHYDPQLKRDIPDEEATFVFQTRDGSWGLLQITDRVVQTGKNFAGLREFPKGAGFHLGVRFNWKEIIP